MQTLLAAIVATVFVLAMFWVVSMTIGKLRVVRNSPTMDDIAGMVNRRPISENASPSEQAASMAEDLPASVREFADSGQKLEAVKAYMEATGVGLLEGKRKVEEYMSRRQSR